MPSLFPLRVRLLRARLLRRRSELVAPRVASRESPSIACRPRSGSPRATGPPRARPPSRRGPPPWRPSARSSAPARVARRAVGLIEPQIGAARAGDELGSGGQRRLPVEDDAVAGADHDGRAGNRAGREELLLDADLREPVGEVADRLVVLEVRLGDPALGLRSEDAEEVAVGSAFGADGELGLVDRLRTDDDARRRGAASASGARPRRAPARANDSSRRPSWLTVEISNTR